MEKVKPQANDNQPAGDEKMPKDEVAPSSKKQATDEEQPKTATPKATDKNSQPESEGSKPEAEPKSEPDEPGPADDRETIFRYDPVEDKLIPIEAKELKVGSVYSHYSQQMGQRVWSFVNEDRSFSYALGQGTTVLASQLDLQYSTEEALQELRRTRPELADLVARSRQPVRLLMNSDHEWIPSGTSRPLAIHNLETGQRWEDHGAGFVPVSHARGLLWTIVDDRFYPAAIVPEVIAGCPVGYARKPIFDTISPLRPQRRATIDPDRYGGTGIQAISPVIPGYAYAFDDLARKYEAEDKAEGFQP